jgi:uncharacterized protein YkwD
MPGTSLREQASDIAPETFFEPVKPVTEPINGPAVGGTIEAALAVANEIRRKHGLPELVQDPSIQAAAQAHAEDMARRHYFEHNNPEGESPFDRMRKAGAKFGWAAENIAQGPQDPEQAFRLWLGSPGHRKNLLNKKYRRHGIGYADGYWVHDFAD